MWPGRPARRGQTSCREATLTNTVTSVHRFRRCSPSSTMITALLVSMALWPAVAQKNAARQPANLSCDPGVVYQGRHQACHTPGITHGCYHHPAGHKVLWAQGGCAGSFSCAEPPSGATPMQCGMAAFRGRWPAGRSHCSCAHLTPLAQVPAGATPPTSHNSPLLPDAGAAPAAAPAGVSPLEQVEECLRRGSWQAVAGSPPDLALALPARQGHSHPFRGACAHSFADVRRWEGGAAPCAAALQDTLRDSFDGVFRAHGVVALAVLGDSLQAQLRSALHGLLSSPARPAALSGLRVVSEARRDGRGPLELATRYLPPSVAGNADTLAQIAWPANASRRVVLLGAGAWYRLAPCGNASRSAGCKHPGDVHLRTNHSHPAATTAWARGKRTHLIKAWEGLDYLWARIQDGTNTIDNYATDVQALATAAVAARAADPRLRVLWVEMTPQHHVLWAADDNSLSWHANSSATLHCPREVTQYMPERADLARARTNGALTSLCTDAQAQARGLAGGVTQQQAQPLAHAHQAEDGVAIIEQCLAHPSSRKALRDWQNRVATPIMRAAAIPIVPLFAALSERSDLHAKAEKDGRATADCTHWCEQSEATHHMASAALNVLASTLF